MNNANYWLDKRTIERMISPPYRIIESCMYEITIQLSPSLSEEEEIVSCGVSRAMCGMCKGAGTVVNPAIDSSGLEEVDDYYLSGTYNIKCPRCRGRRVVEAPDLPPGIAKRVAEYMKREERYARQVAAERAYGC